MTRIPSLLSLLFIAPCARPAPRAPLPPAPVPCIELCGCSGTTPTLTCVEPAGAFPPRLCQDECFCDDDGQAECA